MKRTVNSPADTTAQCLFTWWFLSVLCSYKCTYKYKRQEIRVYSRCEVLMVTLKIGLLATNTL
jgi:hypothetical protein